METSSYPSPWFLVLVMVSGSRIGSRVRIEVKLTPDTLVATSGGLFSRLTCLLTMSGSSADSDDEWFDTRHDQDYAVTTRTRVDLHKFEARINVDQYCPSASRVANQMSRAVDSGEVGKIRIKDKKDRATQDQVLDPRTRMILLKMINRGIIESVNGCVSTGKEANVYHANSCGGEDRAIKVYKTSILTFKDRDKYVSGEFRFRNGYCRHNPRKMVRMWAEKEMRNLTRIFEAGIRCPQPFLLRSHVLVMEFIGTDGLPAPLLKDVSLSESRARQLYLECVILIRDLYKKSKLVHADLSEFNLIYHLNSIVVIDVSQSVEHDHSRALDFLRKDCYNINHFFRKNHILTLTLKELFDFVTDPNLCDEDVDEYLDKAQNIAASRSITELEDLEKQEEQIFLNSFIPRRLDEVFDAERDIEALKTVGNDVIYSKIASLQQKIDAEKDEENDPQSASSSGDEVTGDDDVINQPPSSSARPRNEDPEEKKLRKKAVKDAQRAKRQEKMPKHVKKRLVKAGKK